MIDRQTDGQTDMKLEGGLYIRGKDQQEDQQEKVMRG
jgi:hypothetical protein